MKKLLDKIKIEEGFSKSLYKCPANKTSIGYGTNLEDGISEEFAEVMLKFILQKSIDELLQAKPIVIRLPQDKQEVLFDLAYNMGVPRLLGFKRMWSALEDFNYSLASIELLDSRYAKQVPNRANRNAIILEG